MSISVFAFASCCSSREEARSSTFVRCNPCSAHRSWDRWQPVPFPSGQSRPWLCSAEAAHTPLLTGVRIQKIGVPCSSPSLYLSCSDWNFQPKCREIPARCAVLLVLCAREFRSLSCFSAVSRCIFREHPSTRLDPLVWVVNIVFGALSVWC